MSSNHVRGDVPKTKSTSGWKAFDLKQRQHLLGGTERSELDSKEDYPMLSETSYQGPRGYLGKNVEKPFSSVVTSSINSPPLVDANNNAYLNNQASINEAYLAANDSGENSVIVEACQKLHRMHPWADESLVKDVLAGVGNNVDEASGLLQAMLGSENEDEKRKKVESIDPSYASSVNIQGVSLREPENASFTMGPKHEEASKKLLLDVLKSIPVEPEDEWEDDDVYLIHRKAAIKMIRSAVRHSKAVSDAYAKGDRYNAHQLSLKAQEEWDAAEKLNAKAAKEILSLRNSKNDMWTLDLHGLHATEAVQALGERLLAIESLATLNGVHKGLERSTRHNSLPRQRPTTLQVITGKGNHSRGAASLPSAVRNFLSDNGYRFDETRPGIITVRPKYRQQRSVSLTI